MKSLDEEFGYNIIFLQSHLLTIGSSFLWEDKDLIKHWWGGHFEEKIWKEKAECLQEKEIFKNSEENHDELFRNTNELEEELKNQNVFGIAPNHAVLASKELNQQRRMQWH